MSRRELARAVSHLAVIGPALFAGMLLAGCGRPAAPTEAAAVGPVARVRLATVVTAEIARPLPLPGTVRPAEHAVVAAKVMGTVERATLALGQRVQAGEVLVILRAAELMARVAQAEAALAQATRDSERESALLAQGASTMETVRAADDRRRGAAAALAEAETLRSYTTITAPFEGVITRDLVNPGDLATAGQPLFALEASGALLLEVAVPESLPRLALGEKLEFSIESGAAGTPAMATLVELSPAADGGSRTRLAKLAPVSTAALRSGQFVRVLWPAERTAALLVPAGAVTRFGQMERVFVVAQGRAQLRLVKTGPWLPSEDAGGAVEILTGVAAGERVVVAPGVLRDGQVVELAP